MKSSLPSLIETRPASLNYFRDFMDMQRRMDRFLDRMWNNNDIDIGLSASEAKGFEPACNIEETEHYFVLNFDIPGVKKDDIKVDIQGQMLTVSGERKYEFERTSKTQYRSESSYGAFTRSFELPADVEVDQVEAQYENGVLRIAIPKTESVRSRTVKIAEGQEGVFVKLLGQKKEGSKTSH